MYETYEADRERIQNDLVSFADPGGVDVISATGRRFQVEWRMRGQPREATFTVSRDRGVTVHVDGMNQAYPVFLADTRMADLKHVARMIRQSNSDEIFVSTSARRTDVDGPTPRPATELLTDLMEHGRLIASARSVYYEEEFLKRAGQASATGRHRWSHIPVEIMPWSDKNRASYVDELAKRRSLSPQQGYDLRKRVHLAFENDRQQRPLLSEDRLEKVIGELAEEMWNQETRELDGNSVKEVAEYILHGTEVEESERQIVVERMPTLAFLNRSEKHATIGFEHEVFFFYFLAIVIAQQYMDGADMRAILSRSSLPEFVAERLAFELMRRGLLSSSENLQELLDRLSTAGRTEWRRDHTGA